MIVKDTEAAASLNVAVDATLTRITTAVDGFIKRYCGRDFEREERMELVRSYGGAVVFLREDPVESISEIRVDGTGALGDDTIVTDLTAFTTRLNELHWYGGWFPEGSRTVLVTYVAGYYDADDTDPDHLPKMPEDLRDVAFQLIAQKYNRGASERFQSESIGAYSYTRFDKALEPEIRASLNAFKRW